MLITSIVRRNTHPSAVEIHLDGEFRCLLPESIANEEGLFTGMEIDDDRIAALEASGVEASVREAALRLLGHRARSRAELRKRLIGRKYPPPAVEACIERLAAAGLLDDERFAQDVVTDRLRHKPKGRSGLRRDLLVKGIDPATAERVVRQVVTDEGETELSLARAAARKFRSRPGEPPPATRRRLGQFLQRRGFSSESITAVVEARVGEDSESSEEDERSQSRFR